VTQKYTVRGRLLVLSITLIVAAVLLVTAWYRYKAMPRSYNYNLEKAILLQESHIHRALKIKTGMSKEAVRSIMVDPPGFYGDVRTSHHEKLYASMAPLSANKDIWYHYSRAIKVSYNENGVDEMEFIPVR